MSWLCKDSELAEDDLRLLSFEPKQSRVFELERKYGTQDIKNDWPLTSEDEWQEWLHREHETNKRDNSTRITLIIGGRAERPWGHSPELVAKMPWSRDIFVKIKSKLLVHPLIIRAINRNTSCMFSRWWFDWKIEDSTKRSLIYNCRTAATWSQDMALSVTFLPDSLTTNAILFGIDMKKCESDAGNMTLPDMIISRLLNSDIPVCHPMLLPAILADIERDRQITLARIELRNLSKIFIDLNHTLTSEPSSSASVASKPSRAEIASPEINTVKGIHIIRSIKMYTIFSRKSFCPSKSEEKLQQRDVNAQTTASRKPRKPTPELWRTTSRLRLGLENWKRQLEKMIEHVKELNVTEFAPDGPLSRGKVRDATLRQMREAGIAISERLHELVDEYDEYSRECTHIMDGMALATQLELSNFSRIDAKTNLEVARMTRQDGRLMKSIAFLGMIFLPATLVTSFFSMGFFDWAAGKTVSSYIWIWVVTVVGLTLLTFGIFHFVIWRRWNSQDSERSSGEASMV